MSKISHKLTLAVLLCTANTLTMHSSLAADTLDSHLSVQKIDSKNAESLIQGGPDATGGIGDWHLSNGILCATISGVDHESEFSTKGGALIDLGFCKRDDDHYTFNQDLLEGKRTRPFNTHTITSEQNKTGVSILVQSGENGIEQTTRYHLNAQSPTQLHISKKLTRTRDDLDNDFSLHSSIHFNHHSLESFVFSSQDITASNGFEHEDFVSRGTSAITAASRNADTIITLSPPNESPAISYGWQIKSAVRVDGEERYPIPRFALADDASNAFIFLADTFYIGDGSGIGWMQLGQIPLLSLDKGSHIVVEEIIYVGKKNDVASITDQLFNDTVLLTGTSSDVNSAIHIDDLNGAPVTHIRPNTDGSFSASLPKGEYRLRHVASANRQASKTIELTQKNNDIGHLLLPKAGTLILPKGQAMRLIIKGVEGTQDPNFIDTFTQLSVVDDNGIRFAEGNPQVFLAGLDGDLSEVALKAGSYRVYATRGPEYSLEKTSFTIKDGEQITLNIKQPSHNIPTPGYIASDLHVHSGISYDNSFSEKERVRTFIAEHGEVLVSSEHDIPVDFSPLIAEMGASEKITAIAAVEITSLLPTEQMPFTGGHTNVFPFTPQPHEFRRGSISNEDRRLREIIHDVRRHEPNALIQLNHPRANLALSSDLPSDHEDLIDFGHYLDHMGAGGFPYNPEKPLHSHPNNTLTQVDENTGLRDIDFDLIEMINPGGPDHEERLLAVRKDWLSFIKQGERIVATANSDSHSSHKQVGLPRTMVAMKNDQVSQFNQPEFLQSLKQGNAYGTTGPMIEVSLSGKQMGDTFEGSSGELNLTIFSAQWIKVTTAKIQINGETVKEFDLNDQLEQQLSVPLTFSKDSFVTIEVSGPATDDYAIVYPEITPYAFSNPIYVDHNSDGQWQAPGL